MYHNEIVGEFNLLKEKAIKAIIWHVCTKNVYYVRLNEWVGESSPRFSFNGLDVIHGVVFNVTHEEHVEVIKSPLSSLSLESLVKLLNTVENRKYEEWEVGDDIKNKLAA